MVKATPAELGKGFDLQFTLDWGLLLFVHNEPEAPADILSEARCGLKQRALPGFTHTRRPTAPQEIPCTAGRLLRRSGGGVAPG